LQLNRRVEGLGFLHHAIAIREHLCDVDPENVDFKIDYSISQFELAQLGDGPEQRYNYVVITLGKLKQENRLASDQVYRLNEAREKLAELRRN
jgi:hypothetical protein